MSSKVMLVGNVTTDIVLAGGAVKFSLAVTVPGTERRETFGLVAFGKRAELLAKFATKGARMLVGGVIGALTMGGKVQHQITVEDFQLLGGDAR